MLAPEFLRQTPSPSLRSTTLARLRTLPSCLRAFIAARRFLVSSPLMRSSDILGQVTAPIQTGRASSLLCECHNLSQDLEDSRLGDLARLCALLHDTQGFLAQSTHVFPALAVCALEWPVSTSKAQCIQRWLALLEVAREPSASPDSFAVRSQGTALVLSYTLAAGALCFE
eukprot:m.50677 g.50677  ORF g.50677 m.50677 type:complete len:171 (+) comp6246_c0_seq4:194-706(+)